MTNVEIKNPDGSVEIYATTCPLWVYVEITEESFRDPDELREMYGDEY
jgi:hypothetical protein